MDLARWSSNGRPFDSSELKVMELCVDAFVRQEFFMGAGLHDLAGGERDDARGTAHRCQPVRDDESGPIDRETLQRVEE